MSIFASCWTKAGVFFVTRPLHHMVFTVAGSRPVAENSPIRADQTVRFNSGWALRHGFYQSVSPMDVALAEIVLVTNHFGFAASTLAKVYKERWHIELFFKAIKQNLKIKTFVGTTENALHIQIWTALLAILLLKWLHHLSRANWSLSNLTTMLRLNLFTHRDLLNWLHTPFGTPPLLPAPQQLSKLLFATAPDRYYGCFGQQWHTVAPPFKVGKQLQEQTESRREGTNLPKNSAWSIAKRIGRTAGAEARWPHRRC